MNQDSEQNRSGRPNSRRDGESRSFGRRDDAPRFNRSNNSARNDRSADSDRPRFSRDTNDRNDRGNSDRSGNDRPRFSRDGGNDRNERPSFNRGNTNDRSGSDRSGNDRPRFNRDGGSNRGGNDRPRFDRDRNDRGGNDRSGNDRNSNDRPRFNREGGNDRGERPSFNRDRNNNDRSGSDRNGNDRPRFNREGSSDRGERPSFNRDRNDRGNDRGGSDRPRFNREGGNDRGERPSFNRDRNDRGGNERGGNDRPRFNREGGNGSDRGERPSFNRDRNDRSDKPTFKRVGGFQRDADERNRENWNRTDRNETPRRGRRQDGSSDPSDRFTSEQRKDSGERRTGQYKKAPNYELEIARNRDRQQRNEYSNRGDYKQADKDPQQADAGRNDEPGLTRLNRYIANSGVCSRREADALIAQGDISVNGKVVTEMGYKVKDGDTVKYGTKVLNPERFVYVLLNKPKDYITTTDDPEERKTVMELVADAGNFRMYPVGRLDRNTTGLLLLTNDGELADKLTHPSYNVRKIYQVELDKPITEEHFSAIKQGIELEDGEIKPDALSIVTPDAYVVGIEIHSGRNRIVRRIFEHFGYEVTKLDRTTYAGLTKKELPRGKWRFLEPKEVIKLKYLN